MRKQLDKFKLRDSLQKKKTGLDLKNVNVINNKRRLLNDL